jgi:hypothetical protein
MTSVILITAALFAATPASDIGEDRWVFLFGYSLLNDEHVLAMERVIERAGASGYNGAVLGGVDRMSQQPPEYFRSLARIKESCRANGVELIPTLFSVGYGGSILSHDRNLAEGMPVVDAPFRVEGAQAQLAPSDATFIANGGFETFDGDAVSGFSFHDDPGLVTFADTDVFHGGGASMRVEASATNEHGHGRVMQVVDVTPHRCYRVRMWVKTEDFGPDGALRMMVLADGRNLAPRDFRVPATADWQELTMLFNSRTATSVRVYAGLWNGSRGQLWLDDWSIEEVGLLNVLRRDGTPVRVTNADGSVTYEEGRDYRWVEDPDMSPWRDDHESPPLRIGEGSRIADGDDLLVSWYHPMMVNRSQVTVCMGEERIYEIMDAEAKLLAEHLPARTLLLATDEVRSGGTCEACRGRNMGELLGECITRQTGILRRYNPGARVAIWSDMLDPHHNAHGDYYLVEGDFTGSWEHVPDDLLIAVWGGGPREDSLRFFADRGSPTIIACYYDADDLTDVGRWLGLARDTGHIQGFMYTTWERKYGLLEEFSELLRAD